jgi:hypothetical protein
MIRSDSFASFAWGIELKWLPFSPGLSPTSFIDRLINNLDKPRAHYEKGLIVE